MDSAILLRPSVERDITAIAAIYRHHVLHGIASFEEIPPETDEIAIRWREIVASGLPYLVAERHGRVLGYCYASLYRTRSAYRFSVEDSIYIDHTQLGRGIGRALLSETIARCTALGYRQMIAVIGGSETVSSIRLHAALGFAQVGIFPAIGFKFGRWIDSVYMQRALGPSQTTLPQEIPHG